MTRQLRKFTYIVTAFLLVVSFILSFIVSSGVGAVYAATSGSNVLDDLKKDESFNAADYPAIDTDYSLNVIQIAESTDGELLIYVYQPAGRSRKLIATNVNMALSERLSNEDTSYTPTGNEFSGEGFGGWAGGGHGGGGWQGRSAETATSSDTEAGNTEMYSLTLINSAGIFAKYRVDGVTVSNDTTRYYNISTIYRAFDSTIDDEADNDNTISKVAFKVGQLWTAITTTDGVQYAAKEIEVVKLTSQMIGMRRYSDGFQFDGTKSLDSHYIAFTCDHKIDKLLSADVEFDTRSYKAVAGSGTTYGSLLKHHRVTLYDYQVASNDGSGWFGKKEEWHRMTSTKSFVNEVDVTKDEKETLLSYDWILNFYESEYKNEAGGKDVLISGLLPFGFIWTIINACTTTGELVFDVSLLRLEFEYDGNVYNLGVVSNVQTGTNKPTNTPTSAKKVQTWVWVILGLFGLIALIAAVVVLCIFCPPALKGIVTLLKYVAMGLWYIISAPFRLIALIVRKLSERKEAAPTKAKSKSKSKPRKTSRAGKTRTRSKKK